MNIIYWRGCPFQVLRSNPIVREVILDESNQSYKWTKWTVSAIVSYNPQAISYAPSPSNPGPGVNPRVPNLAAGMPDRNINTPRVGGVSDPSGPFRMPADTDVAIRRFLEFPRGNLVIFSTNMITGAPDSVVLRSPAINANGSTQACDANNGPFCTVNSIQEIAGERLWQIHLVFTTFIREDSLASGAEAPILISNQWNIAVDTNWQHLTTRIIEGIVYFRSDRLINTLNPAEAFRSTFSSYTVPDGFQRTQVQCRTLASGNQVAYRVVDTDQPFQKLTTAALGSVRLEYTESSWMWQGSVGRGAVQALNQGFEFPPIFAGPSAIGAWARGRVLGPVNAGIAQLPKRYKTIIARAWGNREMTRDNLINLCLSLVNGRMGTTSIVLPSTAETVISYHSAQMMAQVQATYHWSFSETGGLGNLQNTFSIGNALFSNPNGGVGDATFNQFASQGENAAGLLRRSPNQAQTPFPHDSGTRGTWSDGGGVVSDPDMLARLTTQALETLGSQDPGAPP